MDLFKGLFAGALAGVAASWAMERFQEQWAQAKQTSGSSGSGQDEPSTIKAADRVALAVTGSPVAPAHREAAGELVHYTTGAGIGAVYGLVAEIAPGPSFGFGAAYGTAVALGLDEAIVPALGLSKKAKDTPPSEHAYSLASHLVYGLTLEGARRIIRLIL